MQDIAETVIVSAKTGYTNPELKGINKVIGRIQAMPTADVQEVVRCKDCKKFCPYLSFCADNCIGAFGHCQITHMNVSPDFYCGYGEKMIRSDIKYLVKNADCNTQAIVLIVFM